jgi:hypothetical protein
LLRWGEPKLTSAAAGSRTVLIEELYKELKAVR